jgi:PAS domain S-box-containing protein
MNNIDETVRSLSPGFDLIQDHVIITDPNGHIIYANDAVEKNTGFSRSEILGKTPGQLWGGLMPKEFYEKMWHTIKIEKKFFVGDVQNLRKDQTKYWQRLHITPILDKAGEVVCFLGIEPNITKWKEAEGFTEAFTSAVSEQKAEPKETLNSVSTWLNK